MKYVRGEQPAPVEPVDGKSDEDRNPLVVATRIGAGVVGAQPGRFAVCLPRRALTNVVAVNARPGNYQGFFARVYDGPTVEESHYYIDSEVVGYDPDAAYTNLVFLGSMKSIVPEDEPDSDNDGLVDSLELEYGTDYRNPDTDGDGILDGVEVAYDLDPTAPLAITAISSRNDDPAISSIPGIADSEWHVEWPAGTDLKYKLQLVSDVAGFAMMDDDEDDSYLVDEMEVEPSQPNWAQDITEWVNRVRGEGRQRGFIRLKLVLPPEAGGTGE